MSYIPSHSTIFTKYMSSTLNPYATMYVPYVAATQPNRSHTFWETAEFPPNEESSLCEIQHYEALSKLKMLYVFKRKFAVFAEKCLYLSGTDTEKGCQMNPDAARGTFDGYQTHEGKKKSNIGFWFIYRQDGISYNIVYECDNINDPTTGWFFQWEHDEECCGFSCDWWGCHVKYQPN